jgi:amidohydrolase
MDALPLTEKLPLSFASKETAVYDGKTVGVMHACGHDTHVAMLMGTATVLSQMKDKVRGTVVFVFQPAEEGAPKGEVGGASLMIKEGVMDKPKIDAMFGLHIASNLEVGKIKYKSGAAMASSDPLTIIVKGKGTHGAMPWEGIDPIVVSAQIVMGLQTIVSRQAKLTLAPVVITIGKIESGVRGNIIPDDARMVGTIRNLDPEQQKAVHAKIKRTAEKIAESVGATAEVSIETGNPIVYNTLLLGGRFAQRTKSREGSASPYA